MDDSKILACLPATVTKIAELTRRKRNVIRTALDRMIEAGIVKRDHETGIYHLPGKSIVRTGVCISPGCGGYAALRWCDRCNRLRDANMLEPIEESGIAL